MKYYILIMMICAMSLRGTTTIASTSATTESNKAKQYYISHSPYYTAGYLGAGAEYSQLTHRVSPYWRSKNISRPVNISLRRKYI